MCQNGVEKFILRQNCKPSKRQKLSILELVLAKVTRWCMLHHVYKFNDQIYHQKDGTPIGLQIAVSISRLVMIRWDRNMMNTMININIRVELMLRYVDDVNLILTLTQPQIDKICQTPTPNQKEIESAIAEKKPMPRTLFTQGF